MSQAQQATKVVNLAAEVDAISKVAQRFENTRLFAGKSGGSPYHGGGSGHGGAAGERTTGPTAQRDGVGRLSRPLKDCWRARSYLASEN